MNELDLLGDGALIESGDAVAIARRELGDFSDALALKLLDDAGAELHIGHEIAAYGVSQGRRFVRKADLQRVIKSCRAVGCKESAHPVPVKGRPETMEEWIKWVIEIEMRLALDDLMPYGLKKGLVNRAADEYGFEESSVNRAWKKLGLKSAHRTR